MIPQLVTVQAGDTRLVKLRVFLWLFLPIVRFATPSIARRRLAHFIVHVGRLGAALERCFLEPGNLSLSPCSASAARRRFIEAALRMAQGRSPTSWAICPRRLGLFESSSARPGEPDVRLVQFAAIF